MRAVTTNEPPAGAALRPERRKLYGRRKGKPLRVAQQLLLQEALPRLRVPLPAGRLDPRTLFNGEMREIWLEIGFGGGEHLAHQAAANPDVGFIGCEPFVNGIAMLLGRLEREGISNVRVHPSDARDLIDLLPDACLARVFLLYPDPWPKARHHRRRFMNPENLRPLARVMRKGAVLRLATDIEPYLEHGLEAVAGCADLFETCGPVAIGRGAAWPDWPGTRYEAKAIRAGRLPHYVTFRRI